MARERSPNPPEIADSKTSVQERAAQSRARCLRQVLFDGQLALGAPLQAFLTSDASRPSTPVDWLCPREHEVPPAAL